MSERTGKEPNLWRDTPGASFTDKFAVLLDSAEMHRHGKNGRDFVSYNDAVDTAHALMRDKNRAREDRR